MPVRLKLLKDEIKQPYFITLKKFLWDEGVRGPDESLPTCKIYPARKPFKYYCCLHITGLFSLARDIYAWSNTPLGKVKVVIIGQGECASPRPDTGIARKST